METKPRPINMPVEYNGVPGFIAYSSDDPNDESFWFFCEKNRWAIEIFVPRRGHTKFWLWRYWGIGTQGMQFITESPVDYLTIHDALQAARNLGQSHYGARF